MNQVGCSLGSSFGLILYSISNIFSASLMYPQSWTHSALSYSMSPQLAFIVSLISLMMFFGAMLLDPKARMIFPLELCELGRIYLVFQVILLFLREQAEGTLLQSMTKNYLLRQTLMSTSKSLYFHFSLILYLKVNSMLLLLTYRLQTNSSGTLSGVNDYFLMIQSMIGFDLQLFSVVNLLKIWPT